MSAPIVNQDPNTPVMQCRQCGRPHLDHFGRPGCRGHSTRRGGAPCERVRNRGVEVCYTHGGNAKQVKAKAKRNLEAAALEQAVITYGARHEINPIQAMVELLHDSAGHVAWLRDIIRAQSPEALVWGIADEVDKGSGEFPGVDVRRAAAPSVWLQRYDVERRLMLDVSRDLAKLGIEWEDREAIRRQGAALARVVRETARLLGHDPNDAVVARAFSSALRVVLGAGVDVDRVLEGRLA